MYKHFYSMIVEWVDSDFQLTVFVLELEFISIF